MPNALNRRHLLAALGTAGTVLLLPLPALAEPVIGDVPLGEASAPVTVIEYASFTCPHCAAFHRNNWARLKAEYIDTGKVRFILRDVYFDRYGLWASMTARCGGPKAFYPIAGQFLEKQEVWTKVAPEQIGGEIARIGRLNGLSSEQLEACLTDQDYAKRLIEVYQKNAAEDEVTSTPTFIINGEKHTGNMPFEEIAELIDAHL